MQGSAGSDAGNSGDIGNLIFNSALVDVRWQLSHTAILAFA
ncbi:hypothetical protein RSSM_01127 [Rhodopirellula sallentina SM41]|uniref:Uncharacterized protein n=1 Tax=Rhodopirellula sallentina SM41 TaxID=1263870 RepID=M5U7K1_9BACT|nr:hypothetical protein RSSM_01127 [Rhodopirellula sallentina SM41]